MGKAGRETARAMEAFEVYYLMGIERSLARVSDEMGISIGTVTKWSTKYNWVERVKQRDEKNMRLVAYADDKAYVESLRGYAKIVDESIKKYNEALTKGKVVVNNPKDLDKLMRLSFELSDRLAANNNDKLNANNQTAEDSLKVTILEIKGEVEEARNNEEDETNDDFNSVEDLIDDDDNQE